MKIENHWFRIIAVLLAFSVVAAACGGSSDSAASDGAAAESDTETEAEDTGGGAADDEEVEEAVADAAESDGSDIEVSTATNMEELEAEWAANREATVAMLTEGIEAGDFGVGDDNILRGPSGYQVDLNNCPGDWTDTEGVGETIKIGYTGPESGNLASYGNMGVGWETYVNYVNETHGGIDGVPIELVKRDDQYVATVTIEQVDELLQSVKPFMFHALGTPSVMATYGTLNEKCVPQLLVATGHPAWGDPVNHPWTTGSQLGYLTEAILWGAWIKENMVDKQPVTVVGLVMDNDFGIAYTQGMEQYAEENPDVIERFVPILFDPAAPTITNEMTTALAEQPDIAIGMMAGNPCLQMVEEAGRNGMKDAGTVLFISSTCKDPNSFMIPAGEAADGWMIAGGGQKVNTDPAYADDVYVQFVNGLLDEAGLDKTIGLYFTGFFYAWPTVEAMRIANELPGGLTRTNMMLAIRSLNVRHPGIIDGISFQLNGNEDAYFIEGSDFSRFDAANATWVQEGGIVDLNGSSPNCAWGTEGCG